MGSKLIRTPQRELQPDLDLGTRVDIPAEGCLNVTAQTRDRRGRQIGGWRRGQGDAGMEFKGGCLCGAVRYRIDGPLRNVIACHCTQCRRQSGHYGTYAAAPLESFSLEKETTLSWYRSSDSAQRAFCRMCGSNLFWKETGGADISVTAGTLDSPTGLSIAEHIFCQNKGDYYEITDGKPQKPQW
jgi:hypothetical protein